MSSDSTITPEVREYLSQLGKSGGKTTAKIHGTKHFQEMAKRSAEVRKKKQADRLSTGNTQ